MKPPQDMTGNRYYSGSKSPHFDGARFFNPDHPSTDRRLTDLLRWRLRAKRPAVPDIVGGRQVVPAARVDGLRVTMVGHATVLIQMAGLNLLVDPIWSERASPVPWAGPRRVMAPGIAFNALPHIDAVLLTHNHYDHLDIPTLKRLRDQYDPRVITPLGNDTVIARGAPGMTVQAADWGGTVGLGAGCDVTLHPAQHWSARGAFDRRMALWCGFVIRAPGALVYVAGDTGYGNGRIFRDVQARFGAPDLAILPIGAYAPRWFMQDQHCNPEEAVQIMLDCGARAALGVHWGTFLLSDEPWGEPREKLRREVARLGLAEARFRAAEPGDVWEEGILF